MPASSDVIVSFNIVRFEYLRDRVVGDSQVRFDKLNAVALEFTDAAGRTGLGFAHSMFDAYASRDACERAFAAGPWREIEGSQPQPLIHRVERPRGGNRRDRFAGLDEAVQIALWDLAARQADLPLATYLGGVRESVPAYASGLDFHLDDAAFTAFFGHAAELGFKAFKIKVGAADLGWDLHRLALLRDVVGPEAGVMIDANEAWTAKQAVMNLEAMRRAGHDLVWVEDPILRDDFEGLALLRAAVPWTAVNSGEYLDASGRRRLLQMGATDILNVHGRITEVMRLGWLAADMGVPVSLGNTFLEIGVHAACALPEVAWMEHSFQNYDHLVDEPIRVVDGRIYVPDRPGHGLRLSDAARTIWASDAPQDRAEMAVGPPSHLLKDQCAAA